MRVSKGADASSCRSSAWRNDDFAAASVASRHRVETARRTANGCATAAGRQPLGAERGKGGARFVESPGAPEGAGRPKTEYRNMDTKKQLRQQ